MKQITQIGATKEEAISLALQKLGVSREQVNIEVLQEAKRGFLGIGARSAEVRVTVIEQEEKEELEIQQVKTEEEVLAPKDENNEDENASLESQQEQTPERNEDELVREVIVDPIESATQYLTSIAKELGIHDLEIESKKEGKNLLLQLESEKAALIIGKRGAMLNALQQLTQLVVNKTSKTYVTVRLDVENYRERRQLALEQLAERMADKAIRTGRKVSLEPMPSYERKIIHNALANRLDVETYSEGIEPNRHLVIEPVK